MTNEQETDDSPITTVLIVLGDALHFEPSGASEVLSVKIHSKDELASTLSNAKERVTTASLDSVHVIITASSIPVLYDDEVVTTFGPCLKVGGETTVHVMSSAGHGAADVQAGDVDGIRTSLVLSGLRLESEGMAGDNGWALTARKV